MSKTDDLLKRAEEMVEYFTGLSSDDLALRFDFDEIAVHIQELSDKIKGDAERIEGKELLEEVAVAIRTTPVDDTFNAPHEYIVGSNILAQAAINVIKGEEDDSN